MPKRGTGKGQKEGFRERKTSQMSAQMRELDAM
jgi:hypothetical protein